MSFPAAMAAATLLYSNVFGIFFLAIASLLIAWLWARPSTPSCAAGSSSRMTRSGYPSHSSATRPR